MVLPAFSVDLSLLFVAICSVFVYNKLTIYYLRRHPMTNTEKLQAYYAHTPGAPILQREFGWYCLDRWKREGWLDDSTDLEKLFLLDKNPVFTLGGLGGCWAEFCPPFEEKILEDRGTHELVQDVAGRGVLCFKGRRNGFMPTYETHPVTDRRTWEKNCLWRLDPSSPDRYKDTAENGAKAVAVHAEGKLVRQYMVGGYMYLRALMGPEGLLYMFYDDPGLIHSCMEAWLVLADRVTAEHQKYTDIDELQLDEDICYKNGSLISPDMIREFLFPYYGQLIDNVRRRNRGSSPYRGPGQLRVQLATDGNCLKIIDLYESIGFDSFAPMEVAAGQDAVEIRRTRPGLLFNGAFDKRILARGKDAIDREIDRMMPFMQAHGGFYPTCDHGVPEEVDFEDYLHYRQRMAEFG